MVVDESLLLQTEQPTHEIRTQLVRHAVVDHELLLVAVGGGKVQLATEDGREDVELRLRLGRHWAEAQGRRRSVVDQTTAASGCAGLFKIQRDADGDPGGV